MPDTAKLLEKIPPGRVPYISPTDLIVFKICSCGLRAEHTKRRTDARDTEKLLEMEAAHKPLRLTSDQKALVEPCIADVVQYGQRAEQWFRVKLGIPTA